MYRIACPYEAWMTIMLVGWLVGWFERPIDRKLDMTLVILLHLLLAHNICREYHYQLNPVPTNVYSRFNRVRSIFFQYLTVQAWEYFSVLNIDVAAEGEDTIYSLNDCLHWIDLSLL